MKKKGNKVTILDRYHPDCIPGFLVKPPRKPVGEYTGKAIVLLGVSDECNRNIKPNLERLPFPLRVKELKSKDTDGEHQIELNGEVYTKRHFNIK